MTLELSWHYFSLLGQDDWNNVKDTFLVMGCQCWHYMTLIASSIPPLYLLVQDDQNEMQHEHNVMPMALSIAPLYSLGQDDWNNVQHHFFGHVMPLMPVSVSCDANSVISDTIPFHRSRWSKWDATWLFQSFDTGMSIMWCQWHCL